MDSLDEQEIESSWEREKKYINARKIKSVTKEGIQKEILEKLRGVKATGRNPQSNTDFLIKRKFHEVASKNPNIRKELLRDNIRIIKVKGKQRFQVAKGTPTVFLDGKMIKAGQFLSGKTEEEAIKNLEKKVDVVK